MRGSRSVVGKPNLKSLAKTVNNIDEVDPPVKTAYLERDFMLIYILSKTGKPLMPTVRIWRVKKLLKKGLAKVVRRYPFTIQLLYESTEYVQKLKLGVDSGYHSIGFSVISKQKELLCGTLNCLKGISERLKERSMYRRIRRSYLRYRKPRFNNRKRKLDLAPSIQHKLETHVRLVQMINKILPIQEITIEVANFDIQKIKDNTISGLEYQNGEQKGFDNLREYILHRDNHTCQNPNCGNKSKEIILQVHHIGYWKGDRGDRPSNLITLCTKCHTPKNHKKDYFLYQWNPKLNSFKAETFMSTIRWRLVKALKCKYCYGFETKQKRKVLGIEKTHYNDAFVIAGGSMQVRTKAVSLEQIRRNNRSLAKFYDAKYIDIRTDEKVSGEELNCGRRTRNKNFNTENLHKYRGQKISKGHVSIRRKRYFYQPNDIVIYNKKKYIVQGSQNYGDYVKLNGLKSPVKTSSVLPYLHRKGLCFSLE